MVIEIIFPSVDHLIMLGVALLIGSLIGWEREFSHKPAGLRTHILVCLGATIATIVSNSFSTDPARVAAGVLTGIGFLGAGTIIASKGNVKGLTTAATLWLVATLGLLVGVKQYILAIIITCGVMVLLLSIRWEHKS